MLKQTEQQIQAAFVRYIRVRYPGVLFCASAGGLHTGIRQATKMKAAGYSRGFPDLQFCEPRGGYLGLFLELKRPKGYASPEQKAWVKALQERGYRAEIVKGLDAAITAIDAYMSLPVISSSCPGVAGLETSDVIPIENHLGRSSPCIPGSPPG